MIAKTMVVAVWSAALVGVGNEVSIPSHDIFAGDTHADNLRYRAEIDRVRGLLATDALRESGYLAARDLLESYPASPLLHYEMGCYFAGARKWESAIDEWNEALFADNGKSVVTLRSWEGIAFAEKKRGNGEASIKMIERLAEASPFSYCIQNRLAEAYKATGLTDKAVKAWMRSYRLKPDQADIAAALGIRSDRRKEAVMDAQELLKKTRQSIVMLENGDRRFTGFVALDRGWIISCAHALSEKTERIDVVAFPDRDHPVRCKGEVVLMDSNRDLAVIRCPDLPASATPLSLAPSDKLEQGVRVYTIGHPGTGKEMLTLTPSEGIIADARRKIDDHIVIQCNMSVNPGNSGGPLFTGTGGVVGIVILKSSLEGVSFSVPISEIAELLASAGPLHAPVEE